MQNKKTGFHTIDALRFFAFFKVYLLHFPVDRDFGLFSFLKKGGGIGVVFFFVLSGFLITYNLVREQSHQGHVNLRRFYLRRMLRIWPLFYLFLLVLYLMPFHIKESLGLIRPGYDPDWRFSFAFLENYKIIFSHAFPAIGGLGITWSLCIEEHFYIIWGVAATLTTARSMKSVLVSFILTAIACRFLCGIYLPQYDISTNEIVTSMDYFAIGGLVGWSYALYSDRVDRFILSLPLSLRWAYVAFTLTYVLINSTLDGYLHIPSYLSPTFGSVLFAGLIALVLPRESSIRISESNVLSYLGRISYGLYLFHPIFILIFLHYCETRHIRIDTIGILTTGIIFTFTLTVLTASFFYRFYERPILGLKKYI